jgi:mRNA-degrading endonuclease RelE of RelBE toxin-antitoxin system
MAFQITITTVAEAHLWALPAREQRTLETAILTRLRDQPTTPTRAIKRLRPNLLAAFELRVGELRVLYNVEGSEVILLVIGRKVGNKLIVEGKEFYGRQDYPAEPTGNGPAGDAD